MADHKEAAYTTAEGNDYPAHEETYSFFLGLVKWGTIVVIAIVAGMALFSLELSRRPVRSQTT